MSSVGTVPKKIGILVFLGCSPRPRLDRRERKKSARRGGSELNITPQVIGLVNN